MGPRSWIGQSWIELIPTSIELGSRRLFVMAWLVRTTYRGTRAHVGDSDGAGRDRVEMPACQPFRQLVSSRSGARWEGRRSRAIEVQLRSRQRRLPERHGWAALRLKAATGHHRAPRQTYEPRNAFSMALCGPRSSSVIKNQGRAHDHTGSTFAIPGKSRLHAVLSQSTMHRRTASLRSPTEWPSGPGFFNTEDAGGPRRATEEAAALSGEAHQANHEGRRGTGVRSQRQSPAGFPGAIASVMPGDRYESLAGRRH
jgi:hypothetical protein